MISQRMQAPPGQKQKGSWVAAGVIDDEGTAEITKLQVTGQPGGKALVIATHVLASGDDPEQMIELDSRSWLRPYPPPEPKHRVLVEGTWKLVAGTKAYANLRARGRMYATVTDRVVGDHTEREITLVRDGSAE
jgi:hypothetical protein